MKHVQICNFPGWIEHELFIILGKSKSKIVTSNAYVLGERLQGVRLIIKSTIYLKEAILGKVFHFQFYIFSFMIKVSQKIIT